MLLVDIDTAIDALLVTIIEDDESWVANVFVFFVSIVGLISSSPDVTNDVSNDVSKLGICVGLLPALDANFGFNVGVIDHWWVVEPTIIVGSFVGCFVDLWIEDGLEVVFLLVGFNVAGSNEWEALENGDL